MECQECHQNPATVHFTKIINGEKNEMHLCEKCAQEKGEMISGAGGFSMNSLLSGLLNFDLPLTESPNTQYSQSKQFQCPKCGMTYEQFSKVGRFGCSQCYKTFDSILDPILKRVHSGNTKHAGKIPKRIGGDIHIRKEISQLKQELQQCVVNEEFEKAAEYRDRIKALEKKLNIHGEGDQ